ncbi:hypothetical protein [Neptuniibacter sp. CAU 1671]|uniref:PA4570 family protein n=1 Tax=Neptuniibacter sp. CAU 1671 TaxID=3032593 RepID=UPI0023DB8D0A|nr:hypothetical protein [Neptuniibacter sp. CAU 1671]MDF2182157.1 hypothetical protein [Neptuniibacter sp. CAU 1671]
MTYQIDAWLERSDPYLRIIDCQSGVVVMEWRNQRLKGLLEQGDITRQELEDKSTNQQALVRDLFLYDCIS